MGHRGRRAPAGAKAALAAALVVGITGACARQGVPTGGPEDRRPPVVVATFPAPFDTLEDLDVSIRFEFDERISERTNSGTLEDAVTISPRGGELRIDHDRHSIEASVRGGLRPGLVYRVTLEPVVVDLFGNPMVDPFELVFSTGGEVSPTTLAGQVWDRTTGRGIGPATVHAIGPDSLIHQAVAGSNGIYAFRYMPAGEFRVIAFDDRNRDDEPDSTETSGTAAVSLATGDTLLVDIPLLAPDTSPAVVLEADALDSVTIAAAFDDFLAPDVPAASMSVSLDREEGGGAPAIDTVLSEADYLALRETVVDSFARLDSIEQAEAMERVVVDTPAVDTLAPPPDTVVVDTAGAPRPEDTAMAGGVPPRPGRTPPVDLRPLEGGRPGPLEGTDRVVPGRRIVVLLAEPLEPGVAYIVRISGALNLAGLEEGGGEDTLTLEPPDTAIADSVAVPDTGRVDTLALPDTGRVDTLAAVGGGGPAALRGRRPVLPGDRAVARILRSRSRSRTRR